MDSRTWRVVRYLRILLKSLSDRGEVMVKVRGRTLCGSMSFTLGSSRGAF